MVEGRFVWLKKIRAEEETVSAPAVRLPMNGAAGGTEKTEKMEVPCTERGEWQRKWEDDDTKKRASGVVHVLGSILCLLCHFHRSSFDPLSADGEGRGL